MSSYDDLTFYDMPTTWGDLVSVTFAKNVYMDGNTAIMIYSLDEDGGYLEPYADLTVNVEFLADPYRAAIDTNNLGEAILGWLEGQDIAEPTGGVLHSGFCNYPICEFSQEWLDELPSEDELY